MGRRLEGRLVLLAAAAAIVCGFPLLGTCQIEFNYTSRNLGLTFALRSEKDIVARLMLLGMKDPKSVNVKRHPKKLRRGVRIVRQNLPSALTACRVGYNATAWLVTYRHHLVVHFT